LVLHARNFMTWRPGGRVSATGSKAKKGGRGGSEATGKNLLFRALVLTDGRGTARCLVDRPVHADASRYCKHSATFNAIEDFYPKSAST